MPCRPKKKQRTPGPFVGLQREGGKLGHAREKLCWHAGLLPLGHEAMQLVWPGLAWSWACWTAAVGLFFGCKNNKDGSWTVGPSKIQTNDINK